MTDMKSEINKCCASNLNLINNKDTTESQLEGAAHDTLIFMLTYTDLNNKPYPRSVTYDEDIKRIETSIKSLLQDTRFVNQDSIKYMLDGLWRSLDD